VFIIFDLPLFTVAQTQSALFTEYRIDLGLAKDYTVLDIGLTFLG